MATGGGDGHVTATKTPTGAAGATNGGGASPAIEPAPDLLITNNNFVSVEQRANGIYFIIILKTCRPFL
jgi:hypothetical protein